MVDLYEKGVDLRTYRLTFRVLCLAAICFAGIASAQEDTEDEVLISVDVGYNSAYRDRSWVPIDVFVRNEQSDLQGMVEVRTYTASGQLQSPVYRIPADCPQDSYKRFRLMAYLDRSTKVEAWIYENDRPAVDTPAYMEVAPIRDEDLLGLILDNQPLDYTFLNIVLDRADNNVRFYRQPYLTPDLGTLPGHIEAYKAVDFIVLGDIDPGRVSQSHRTLLREYVESGGSLIVHTGLLSQRFSGTWVEELSGVEFGPSQTMPEREAGAIAFSPSDRVGLSSAREVGYAALRPLDATASVFGADPERPLAVRTSVGSGFVCTLAVDSGTHAFQEHAAFQRIWAQMLFSRTRELPLNYELYANSAAQHIPTLSGVTVRPLSFLLMYLGLYVGVGIIGNWLFWNHFKRREMAWVCLIGFSAAFSGYAFVEGTSGWAKSAESNQIDVIHLKRGSEIAETFGLLGVLTSHTSNYSGEFASETSLVRDIPVAYNRYSNRPPTRRTPFIYVQGDAPEVERFTVGAAELRFMALEGTREVAGGITGELTVDDAGISGTLQNESGLPMDSYVLAYEGAMVPVRKDANGLHVYTSHRQLSTLKNEAVNHNNEWTFYASWGQRGYDEVLSVLRRALMSDSGSYQLYGHYPPMLIGWREEVSGDALSFDQELGRSLATEILVGEIVVRDARMDLDDRVREQLMTMSPSGQFGYLNVQNPNEWHYTDFRQRNANGYAIVRVPVGLETLENTELRVKLYASMVAEDSEVKVLLNHGQARYSELDGWHDAHLVSTEDVTVGNRPMRVLEYVIQDWQALVEPDGRRQISFQVRPADDRLEMLNKPFGNWGVVAYMDRDRPELTREDWPGWQ